MPGIDAFDKHAREYDDWYDRNPAVFQSELAALKTLLPENPLSLEIGVGTGRFASALKVDLGAEPACNMARLAARRGITTVSAVAERLPFRDNCLDSVLIVTAICFLDNVNTALAEIRRVLRPNGSIIIGYIDRDSSLGQKYLARRKDNLFYRHAVLYSTAMIRKFLEDCGFSRLRFMQTLTGDIKTMSRPETPREGYGDGGFVVIRAEA